MNTIYDVPRAVAITSTNTIAGSVVTAHANELFYVTGHTSATSSNQWAASGGGGSPSTSCNSDNSVFRALEEETEEKEEA
jgi:hypothetical protein